MESTTLKRQVTLPDDVAGDAAASGTPNPEQPRNVALRKVRSWKKEKEAPRVGDENCVTLPLRKLREDSVGELRFGALRFPASSKAPSKWIRLEPQAPMVHVVDLLTKSWKQAWPSVLISLPPSEPASPSAPVARMDPTDRLNLRQGLLKGVETAKAWILTDGADEGTTRLIGRMMVSTDAARELVCIGINSWERMLTTDQMAGSRPNGHVSNYKSDSRVGSSKDGSGGSGQTGSGKEGSGKEPAAKHAAGGNDSAPALKRTSSSDPNAAGTHDCRQAAEH